MAKRSVLLVDDEESVAKGFARVLAAADYETRWACNGLVASRILEQCRFDAMVTDIFMPEREGLETIREVHKLYPGMGIVAVSGGFGTVDVLHWLNVALALGAAVVLKKPVTTSDLIAAVGAAISHPGKGAVKSGGSPHA
jgi:DNA-binding NtrC family response regulator